MNRSVPIEVLSLEQQVESLRHHALMFTGYALSLVEKMGVPYEAAALFMQPLTISTQAISLEDQAKSDAIRMSMTHGIENVSLTQRDTSWLIHIRIGDDKAVLEQWGVPISFWADWLGQQAQLLGNAKGIKYLAWLESDIFNIQLEAI